MENEVKKELVPYDMVLPGFEAIYTGEKSTPIPEKAQGNVYQLTDDNGNMIVKWSTWAWTWPGQEKDWGDEIKYINRMQEKLGLLDDNVRQIRAHIGSLVPCDSGVPVTIDELLNAVGTGQLAVPSFHNGCWCCTMWWEARESNSPPVVGTIIDDSMSVIDEVLRSYLEGKPGAEMIAKFPYARGFINRSYEWLGPVTELSEIQKLLMERMLLPFDFFTGRNSSYEEVNANCFEEKGRGAQINEQISTLAELPKIYMVHLPEYRENLSNISDSNKCELYKICCYIASGVYGLSNCHHNTFRYIENWIYGIGTGKFGVSTRNRGAERERLGRLLFGYALGLDKWLLGVPVDIFLLDIGYADLGFDPKNEILRVYRYLGPEKTPVKDWLAACLWYSLHNNALGGLRRHKDILERASKLGISISEWMDRRSSPLVADRYS